VLRKSLPGPTVCAISGAWLLISVLAAHAASPDQLYQTWQKNYLRDPDIAEQAAQDYLHAAPQGPYAADLQIWLDAYHKAMASILSQPRTANKGAPANKLASAQPAPPPSAPPPQQKPPAPSPAPPPKFVAQQKPPAPPPALPPKIVAQQKPPMPAALNPPPAPPVRLPKPAAVQPKEPAAPVVNLAAATPMLPKQVAALPAPQPARLAAVPPGPTKRPEMRLASAEPIPQKQAPKEFLARPASEMPLGQSLDEALAFIADKVEGQALAFTAEFFNPSGGALVEQLSYEASNVTIDPNRCQVSYHWHVLQDGRRTPDQDRAVQLRLSRSITVEPIEQALAELNARHFSVHVRPEAYAVHIARWDRPAGDNLYFRDRGMAESVAAAARHALDLCDKRGR
jgi:hypothetical protein